MNIGEIIKELETRRKLFHLFALLFWLLPITLLPRWLGIVLFLVVILLNILTVLRVGQERLGFYYRLVYGLEREKNRSTPGIQALWANLGIFLSFLLFGKEPALVAVVVLAVGDAFASLVGMRYGRRKIGNKSLEGALAFFFSTFFVLLTFIGVWKAAAVSLFSTLAELLPLRLDDNLTVPLTGGFVYWIMEVSFIG